jgi:hypothetical protein
LERISLEGICRVVDVSLPWLLKFIKKTYASVPQELNVVVNMQDIEDYPDEMLDDKIYSLLKKK